MSNGRLSETLVAYLNHLAETKRINKWFVIEDEQETLITLQWSEFQKCLGPNAPGHAPCSDSETQSGDGGLNAATDRKAWQCGTAEVPQKAQQEVDP